MSESRDGAGNGDARGTIAELLRARRAELTQAELRVAQALLADYPAAGLQSGAGLAEAAEVSPPTVVRLATKLGLRGYPELKSALRGELSARSSGPTRTYPHTDEPPRDALTGRLARAIGSAVTASLRGLDDTELQRAVDLLAAPHQEVVVTGGRFSWTLAAHLAGMLGLLRPEVRHIPPEQGARTMTLLDVDADTTVLVFDYRRYSADTVAFGREAADRGAQLVLCTDPYLSPLSSAATVLLTTAIDASPPFVSLAPAMALVETLVTAVVERCGDAPRNRLGAYERLSGDP